MQGVFTIPEVARRLRLSTATVYKLCAVGSIDHFRVLNSIRVHEQSLRSFKASGLAARSAPI
jgi:excisionase family DNA binding protein